MKKQRGLKWALLKESLILIQFANPDFTQPISEVVDEVIQNCPIDVRRPLYKVQNHTPPLLLLQSVWPSVFCSGLHVPPLCVAEHRALRRIHHVQGLWQEAAERPEEDRGRTAENERRAERRQVEGEQRRHFKMFGSKIKSTEWYESCNDKRSNLKTHFRQNNNSLIIMKVIFTCHPKKSTWMSVLWSCQQT